jgi:hypothetical protein
MMPRPEHASGDPVDAPSSSSATEITDNRDHDADRVGDLPLDLETDLEMDLESDRASDLASDLVDLRIGTQGSGEELDEEVWFDPEALAAASRVELGSSVGRSDVEIDRLGHVSALEQLRAVMASPVISLAEIPSWPSADPHDPDVGPALGPALGELLGELRAGDLILVGGRGRGVGRTSLLAQLGDALALRVNGQGPQTPVLCVVEGPAVLWRARSLARWSGLDVRRFLDAGAPDAAAQMQAFCASEWVELDRRQRFVDAIVLREPTQRRELIGAIGRWRTELAVTHGQEVWPILLIDPLEQLVVGDTSLAEVLADLDRLATEQGFIVIASCDDPEPADARRLDRHARARLRVSGSSKALEIELCHRRLGPTGSVRLRWDRASGRIGGP